MQKSKEPDVKIPQSLFARLYNYHINDMRDDSQEQAIQQGLQTKMDAVMKRQDFQDFLLTNKPHAR